MAAVREGREEETKKQGPEEKASLSWRAEERKGEERRKGVKERRYREPHSVAVECLCPCYAKIN
jgi:hypothetical protein